MIVKLPANHQGSRKDTESVVSGFNLYPNYMSVNENRIHSKKNLTDNEGSTRSVSKTVHPSDKDLLGNYDSMPTFNNAVHKVDTLISIEDENVNYVAYTDDKQKLRDYFSNYAI